MGLTDVITAFERDHRLDRVLNPLRQLVSQALSREPRELLQGRWLGTPLHPMLTDVTVGAFTSAAALDLLPGNRRAATTLVAIGVASAAPAAAAGLADWVDSNPDQQRVGLLHAGANTVALGLYLASLKARLTGHHWRGRALGYLGFAVAGASAHVGGHLAYRQAAGVSHVAQLLDVFPAGWQDVGPLRELPDGQPVQKSVGGVNLCVVRRGEQAYALADTCPHQGGSLAGGELDGDCIVCPWHGSSYRLADGRDVRGPTTHPQLAFQTRVQNGTLQVRNEQAEG